MCTGLYLLQFFGALPLFDTEGPTQAVGLAFALSVHPNSGCECPIALPTLDKDKRAATTNSTDSNLGFSNSFFIMTPPIYLE
jgi:hypothetical protein